MININIKKCRQRKAGRERLTSYQSEGPSRTIPINLQIERIERVNSKKQKGSEQLSPIKTIGPTQKIQ